MSLKIIGSGFGRTGTMTMKAALEQLGFGPCHHMVEIIQHPEQLAHWKALSAGKKVDLEDLYAGYSAQVDWPGAHIFEEASKAFPEAKILHTERPEEDWWKSFNGTIGKFFRLYRTLDLPLAIAEIFDTMEGYFITQSFPDLADKDRVIAAYRRHNQKVRDTIPADRLLVFSVAEGWGPLCSFLKVPLPNSEFPHHHPKAEFWAHFGGEPV